MLLRRAFGRDICTFRTQGGVYVCVLRLPIRDGLVLSRIILPTIN